MGPHFKIPPASLTSFTTLSIALSIILYDRYFVRLMRSWTGNPRGISLLQRLGVGLVLDGLVMVVAFLMEKKRLSIAREHGVVANGGPVPITILILLPQFVMIGMAEAFLIVGKIVFFYHQAHEGIKRLGSSLSLVTYGVRNFLSSFLVILVANITQRNGRKGWILNNQNASHLDYYYRLLSIIRLCNFLFFLIVCRFYLYKPEVLESQEETDKGDSQVVEHNRS
ncbi:hypothetical protein HPP92_010958 [Vanilla planifolia]|uniref:Uncharacterized protein n=1 Tax=Vanilla planifolia TaxID=51239 RepID=A0A835V0K4_VANPL|nr:hypothetical protein HPP92_011256 [Vanilla planifolia]KAG0482874.1 hypothetical protein HPP92_010958 [Vanilla planifolia]